MAFGAVAIVIRWVKGVRDEWFCSGNNRDSVCIRGESLVFRSDGQSICLFRHRHAIKKTAQPFVLCFGRATDEQKQSADDGENNSRGEEMSSSVLPG